MSYILQTHGHTDTHAAITIPASLLYKTSVSETIRKPPLVKAQTALRKQKHKIWRETIFNMADGILTPAMWHVTLVS